MLEDGSADGVSGSLLGEAGAVVLGASEAGAWDGFVEPDDSDGLLLGVADGLALLDGFALDLLGLLVLLELLLDELVLELELELDLELDFVLEPEVALEEGSASSSFPVTTEELLSSVFSASFTSSARESSSFKSGASL